MQSKEKARALANVNENILNKVESMIETKKKPEKQYQNNPPKKDALFVNVSAKSEANEPL